jgi:cell division protein FtsZ
MGILEFEEVMTYVKEAAAPDAHIIAGYRIDESLGESITVTVVATGYETQAAREEREAREKAEEQERPRSDFLDFPDIEHVLNNSSKKTFRGDELDVPTVIRQSKHSFTLVKNGALEGGGTFGRKAL